MANIVQGYLLLIVRLNVVVDVVLNLNCKLKVLCNGDVVDFR